MSPTSPLQKQPHDLGIKYEAPKSRTDPRVPTAEEHSLGSNIAIEVVRKSRTQKGWLTVPVLETPSDAPRNIQITGRAILPIYPGQIELDTQITLPIIGNTAATVKEDQIIYLVALNAEVGADQDAVLGRMSFQYLDQTNNTLAAIEKENSRRYRGFWLLVMSTVELTPELLLGGMLTTATSSGHVFSPTLYRLKIGNTIDAGFTIGNNLRVFAKDPNWASEKTYRVEPDSIDLIEVCRVQRLQNFTEEGYTWGFEGEEPFDRDFCLLATGPVDSDEEYEFDIYERLYEEIFAGKPRRGICYGKTVVNLTSGPTAGNPGRPGVAAGSPNGSVCLANDQRTTFTNQAITQKFYVDVACASADANGRALLSTCLNTSAPAGTVFSNDPADHRIYDTDGNEQSAFGTFQNTDCGDSLMWSAGENSTIQPGQAVYFVAGVRYPAGSGLSVPFESCEHAWLNGVEIDSENIRNAYGEDLEAYEDPAGNENYIIMLGRERAAIHYIYKKIIVTTNSQGVAIVPAEERACFAWIEGVAERINSPVKTGLAPATEYKALVYHPPFSLETWQLELKYPRYQGIGQIETTFLEGATITSRPFFFVHTKGSGQSVFQGDAVLQFCPVAMYLPSVWTDFPSYSFDAPIQLAGEIYQGPVTFREMPPLAASGLVLPAPGQVLSTIPRALTQHRSMPIRLLANGKTIGFRSPVLASGSPFQSVLAFAAEKDGEHRLVIMTHNGEGGKDIVGDINAGTGIDIFRL